MTSKTLKSTIIIISLLLFLMNFSVWSQRAVPSLPLTLGARLFREARFAAPEGDLPASCQSCHLFDEDPQGLRPFADFFNRSWISFRTQSPQRFELRNSPALFDVAAQPSLHYDGEFASLEALVKGTFSGRPMGWLPGEQSQAFAHIQKIILADVGNAAGRENYRAQFKKAYGVDVTALSRDEIVNYVARAVADFMRTFKSPMRAPYDEFIKANNLPTALASKENAKIFSAKILAQITDLEKNNTLKLSKNFAADALQGLKIFLRTEGENSVGNCVTCHAPPLFTDFSYHNLGISQIEYEALHGAGKFAALKIPDAATAQRPAAQFREIPTKKNANFVDLGYWNFVNVKASPLRRADENDDQFLGRMIGAMKTPGLRHLAYTYPYMHNGAYTSLADTINEIRRISDMARAGEIRAADEELKKIRLSENDVPALLAFLTTLHEPLQRYAN